MKDGLMETKQCRKSAAGLAFAAAVALAFSAQAREYRAAVYPAWHDHNHSREWNFAFEKTGTCYTNLLWSKESLDDFHAHIDDYDFILVPSLYNFTKDYAKDPVPFDANAYAPIVAKWIQNGGSMLVIDANYPKPLEWLGVADPKMAVSAASCNYLGPAVGSQPMDPVMFFPKRAEYGFYWGHMTIPNPDETEWKVLSRCGHGEPTLLVRRWGKGMVLVSTMRTCVVEFIENLRANQMFYSLGLVMRQCELKDPIPGPNRFECSVDNVSEHPVRGKMTLTLTPEGGESVVYASESELPAKATGTLALDCTIRLRGKAKATLMFSVGDKVGTLFDREIELQDFFKVTGTRYRGLVTTRRRATALSFGVHVYPFEAGFTNHTVRVTVLNALKRTVAQATAPAATGDSRIAVPFVIRNGGPGTYVVRGELLKAGETEPVATSDAELIILGDEPNLTVFDEDLTMLNDGEPFFPMGIYHPAADKGPVAYFDDFATIADVGFNVVNTFGWAGIRAVDEFAELGMKALWEPLPHNTPNLCRSRGTVMRGHPGALIYYTCDEPSMSAFPRVKGLTAAWHETDLNHPTVVVSCEPSHYRANCDLADILAIDTYPYHPNKGENSNIETVSDYTVHAMEASAGRTPVLVVPQAFGYEPEDIWRNMSLQAIVHGAKGLVWYAWNELQPGLGLKHHPDAQKYVAKFIVELKSLVPAILNCAPSPRQFVTDDGRVHGMVATDPKTGTKFLFAVNVKREPASCTLDVPELGTGEAKPEAAFGGETLDAADGKVAVALAKFGSGIWCWGGPKPVPPRLASDFAVRPLPARGSGRTLRVKSGDDLQKALDAAKDGDTIEVGEGTYGPICSDNKFVEIVATGACSNTVIDAGGTARCATLTEKEFGDMAFQTNTLVRGFTLRGGVCAGERIRPKEGGAAVGGTFVGCVFEKNAARYGGAVAQATLENCVLRQNTASANGGAAAYCRLRGCVLTGNTATFDGGAAEYCRSENCTFENNGAKRDGGAAHMGVLTGCTFAKNSASRNGGATMLSVARSCLYRENSAKFGGGAADGRTVLSTFGRNRAGVDGGAVFCTATNPDWSVCSVESCSFVGNQAFALKGTPADELSANAVGKNNWTEISAANTNAAPKGMTYSRERFFMGGNDFRPRPGAPIIDADVDCAGRADECDAAGKRRLVGGRADAAAFEFDPAGCTVFDRILTGTEKSSGFSLGDCGGNAPAFGRFDFTFELKIPSGAKGTLFTLPGGRASTLWAEVDGGRLQVKLAPNGMEAEKNHLTLGSAVRVDDSKRHVLTVRLLLGEGPDRTLSAAVDGQPFAKQADCPTWKYIQLPVGKIDFPSAPGKDSLGAVRRIRLDVAPY